MPQHVSYHRGSIIREPSTVQGSLMMDPLWSETCWSTFKCFIILIVSTYYVLFIGWIKKCLIIIDAPCKHEDKRTPKFTTVIIAAFFLPSLLFRYDQRNYLFFDSLRISFYFLPVHIKYGQSVFLPLSLVLILLSR